MALVVLNFVFSHIPNCEQRIWRLCFLRYPSFHKCLEDRDPLRGHRNSKWLFHLISRNMGFGSFLCLLKAEAAASRLTAVHERCSLMICIRFKSDRDTKILHATTCGMLYAHTSIGEESSALNVQSGGFFHSFSQFRRSIYFNFFNIFNIFNISHKSRARGFVSKLFGLWYDDWMPLNVCRLMLAPIKMGHGSARL